MSGQEFINEAGRLVQITMYLSRILPGFFSVSVVFVDFQGILTGSGVHWGTADADSTTTPQNRRAEIACHHFDDLAVASMSIHTGSSRFVFAPITWEPEVLSKLETHHLVGWSPKTASRTRFGTRMKQFLDAQSGTEVLVLHGRSILDLEGFCAQLERLLPAEQLARSIDGASGVASILRADSGAYGAPVRQRYFLWHDADLLMRSDPRLFDQIVEVMAGVSAELEYISDSGILQRCVYLGGRSLAERARDPESRFHRWEPDGPGVPFWSLVSGEDRPSTAICSIDTLMHD